MAFITVEFNEKYVFSDRKHRVTSDDLLIVLKRLPADTYERLKIVHLNDDSWGGRRIGYTTTRGRREISICALPENISLTRYLRKESPSVYGAKRNVFWPDIAIKRFMLYHVFLHEIGHLQIVNPKAKSFRRKFAGETKAHEFALYWKKRLWSIHYDHPDLYHNPPSKEEFENL